MNSLAESNGSADDAQRLFDLSRDLLSTTDRSGRFVKLNPAWELQSGASVGIATARSPGGTPQTMMREADVAMSGRRGAAGAASSCSTTRCAREVLQRVRVQDDLLHAVDRGELLLHYQPIVNLPETSVAGCEATRSSRSRRRPA